MVWLSWNLYYVGHQILRISGSGTPVCPGALAQIVQMYEVYIINAMQGAIYLLENRQITGILSGISITAGGLEKGK